MKMIQQVSKNCGNYEIFRENSHIVNFLPHFSALRTVNFDLSKEAITPKEGTAPSNAEEKVAEPKKKVTPIPKQVLQRFIPISEM